AVVPDDLRRLPGLAAVEAALEKEIDVAGIGLVVLAALAEGQEGALGRDDQRGDAVGVVAVVAGDEERGLRGLAGGEAGAGRQQDKGCPDYGFKGSQKSYTARTIEGFLRLRTDDRMTAQVIVCLAE